MKKTAGTTHVVVDGSNIATEGRSTPSLAQLNDAVLAYVAQHPNTLVTVVVDATFGHRIDRSERSEFDDAIANNELVAPPAGAIGRGDAFILGVADKAGAVVLSNDSFQEFHGQYSWLFDPGRLIGGKPVPHVGWVFVERMPVRGPISRRSRATSAAAADAVSRSSASPPRSTSKSTPRSTTKSTPSARKVPVPKVPPPRPSGEVAVRAVNDIVAFLDFAERHSTGSRVEAIVHSYASHGAYVSCDGVKCYVPLRLMGTPPPSRAREVMSIGDTVEIEIVEFAPVRRSVDCALVRVVDAGDSPSAKPVAARRGASEKKSSAKKSAARKSAEPKKAGDGSRSAEATKPADARNESTTRQPAETKKVATPKVGVPRKSAAKKATVTKATAARSTASRATGRPARSSTKAVSTKSVSKTAVSKKAASKKAASKTATGRKASAPTDATSTSSPAARRPSRRRRVTGS